MVNEKSLECLSDESLSNRTDSPSCVQSSQGHGANVSAGSFASQDPDTLLPWVFSMFLAPGARPLETANLFLQFPDSGTVVLFLSEKRQHGESLFSKDSGYILVSDP